MYHFNEANIREVLSDRLVSVYTYGEAYYKYAGIEEGGEEGGEEYFSYLRPSAVMDSAGLPVIAWQVHGNTYPYSDTYVITPTHVITWKTTEGLNLQTEDRWHFESRIDEPLPETRHGFGQPHHDPTVSRTSTTCAGMV